MKVEITEKQLKKLAHLMTNEGDVDEQNEPVSGEPKYGTSDTQSGGNGYPEVGIWKPDITGGVADLLSTNRTWAKDGAGSTITRGKDNQLKESVFNAHMTTNGRFMVINDYVFDIQEQKDLGNIWESIDVFKTIFANTECEEEGYKEIQEGIKNIPILENSDNLQVIKHILLEQNWFQRQWDNTKKGISDTAKEVFNKDTWNKMKKVGGTIAGSAAGIPQTEWVEVLQLLKQGALYVFRKLRQAMYSTAGIAIDAILVATGIGKVAPFVVWAMIVGLDVYELATGEYEPGTEDMPMWMRYVQLAGDVLGMILTGAVSKGVRSAFSGATAFLKKGGKMSQYIAKYPKASEFITKFLNVINRAPAMMKRAFAYLQKKSPKLANALQSSMKYMNNIFNKVKNAFKTMIDTVPPKTVKGKVKAGAVAGGSALGLTYGIDALSGGGNNNNEITPLSYGMGPSLKTMDIGDDL
jgi:hypothetical protein